MCLTPSLISESKGMDYYDQQDHGQLDCYMRKEVGENHSSQFIAIAAIVHYTIYEDPGRITLFHFLWHKTTICHAHRLYGSGIWMGHSSSTASQALDERHEARG